MKDFVAKMKYFMLKTKDFLARMKDFLFYFIFPKSLIFATVFANVYLAY